MVVIVQKVYPRHNMINNPIEDHVKNNNKMKVNLTLVISHGSVSHS
jgi:hypothetical protein